MKQSTRQALKDVRDGAAGALGGAIFGLLIFGVVVAGTIYFGPPKRDTKIYLTCIPGSVEALFTSCNQTVKR